MATLKPTTPLHTHNKGPLKPPSPLRPKTAPKHPFLTRKGDDGFSYGSTCARKGDGGFNPTQTQARKGDSGFRQPGRLVGRA